MKLFNNASIKHKMLVIPMVALIGFVVMFSYNFFQEYETGKRLDKIDQFYFPLLIHAQAAKTGLEMVKEEYIAAVSTGDEDLLAEAEDSAADVHNSIADMILLMKDSPSAQRHLAELVEQLGRYEENASKLAKMMIEEQVAGDDFIVRAQALSKLIGEIQETLAKVAHEREREFRATLDTASVSSSNHLYRSFWVCLITITIMLLTAYYITSKIIGAINAAEHLSFKIIAGSYQNTVPEMAQDEIGHLITSLSDMQDRLQIATLEEQEYREALIQSKQAAEEASEMKTMFVANISHELRTPMHAIINFSDMILRRLDKDEPDLEKVRRFTSNISNSASRLSTLINDLLDLSKLQAGKMDLHIEANDMKGLVDHACNELSALSRSKDITVNVEDERKEPQAVSSDKARVIQIIINLLSNAIKFSPEGSEITVHISEIEEQALSGTQPASRIAIRDCGIGVPPDELENIFDSFIQSSKSRTQAGGTGLGLAICREIANAHRGRIYAENNPEGGSTFTLVLPVYQTFVEDESAAQAPIDTDEQ